MFTSNISTPSAKDISDPITKGIVQSGKQSAQLSIIAVGVALISILITAFFSYIDYKGDEKWQSEQISSLNEQVSLLTLQNQTLLKTLTEAKKLNDTLKTININSKRNTIMSFQHSKRSPIPYRLSE